MIVRRLTESCGMNFARYKCDERAAQALMREDAFSLRLGKKSRDGVFANGGQRVGAALTSI
jgi:hypothetical protein